MRWWHGLVFFAVALALQLTVLVASQIAGALGLLGANEAEIVDALSSPKAIVLQVIFTCSALTLLAFLAPRYFRLPARRWLGLGAAPWTVVAASAVGMAGVGFLVDEIIYLIHSVAPRLFDSGGLDAFNLVFYNASPAAFVALTAVVVIGPGIGEEFFFRGFALRSFLADLPAWLAIAMSSVLFGALHMNLLQGFGAFLIGIYLGFAVWRTGSIWPGVISHATNNLLCAFFARFDAGDSGQIWNTGHSASVLVISAAVTAAVVFFIVRSTRPTAE
jgi:membrane protease YdiL (CAAX protease family)